MRKTELDVDEVFEGILNRNQYALARAISVIEDRRPGYRDLVSKLYRESGSAHVVGVTGSPGVGKSTLVDKLTAAYREQDETVGVLAVDPASPFTGGAILGDRVRMGSNAGDVGVFMRSMSARGTLGGLSPATADAITALDAFGKDRILVETVGAGQNEIDVVRSADSVCVLLQPGSGDDVQILKAGLLEIADVLVVNKADQAGTDRVVRDLEELVDQSTAAGSHRISRNQGMETNGPSQDAEWRPPIVKTVATTGVGIEALLSALTDHAEMLDTTGLDLEKARIRHRDAIQTILRNDVGSLLQETIGETDGFDAYVDAVQKGESDPYSVADELLAPFVDCLDESTNSISD